MKKLFIVVFFFVIPTIVFSIEPDYKIGPLLHEKIYPSRLQKAMSMSTAINQSTDNQETSDKTVKIIVVMDRDHLSELSQSLVDELEIKVKDLGGYIGNHAFNNVQVWLPLETITHLAEWDEVKYIKLPTKPGLNSGNVQSEGFFIGNVNSWNNSNITGQGVKVGVFDVGFEGYSTLLGTELPSDTTVAYTGTAYDFYSTKHGTACAEIVHDIAPDADLYLINSADMEVEFINGVTWLEQQGVDIISSSFALNLLHVCKLTYDILNYSSLYQDYAVYQLQIYQELKDQVNYIVSNTVSGGITWVQAANNNGRQRWKGQFSDPDNDHYHNFATGYNNNELILPPSFRYGETIYISMMWGNDTDFITYDDYDLYIIDEYGYTVTSSSINQGNIPVGMEACKFTPIPGRKYYIKIYRYWAIIQDIVLLVGIDDLARLEEYSPEKTVQMGTPCDNPDAITVGAVPYYNTTEIEDFSGQGPGYSGVIKPDLVAPDAVHTASYDWPFFGTSAAAPHVAGVAALVKQMYPEYGPIQIKDYLEQNALDLGPPGKDNVFGSGLVQLPQIEDSLSSINAQVSSLNFYEAPFEGVLYEERNYSNLFDQNTARYIYYELGLEHYAPGRAIEIPLTIKYLYPDGTQMGEFIHEIQISSDWTWSIHHQGWGWSDPGYWTPGKYTIKIFEDAREVTRDTFTITTEIKALTQTQVSQLYVSIFGRASEGEGNSYWQTNQNDMIAAADTMLGTDPAKNYFGATLYNDQAFIEFIYENTLGKTYAEDPEGVDYWVAQLSMGKSKGEVVATLIDAAMDPKYAALPAQHQFVNKVAVSNYTADTIYMAPDINDLSAFVKIISGVTDDLGTVTTAKAVVDSIKKVFCMPTEKSSSDFIENNNASYNLTRYNLSTGEEVLSVTGEIWGREYPEQIDGIERNVTEFLIDIVINGTSQTTYQKTFIVTNGESWYKYDYETKTIIEERLYSFSEILNGDLDYLPATAVVGDFGNLPDYQIIDDSYSSDVAKRTENSWRFIEKDGNAGVVVMTSYYNRYDDKIEYSEEIYFINEFGKILKSEMTSLDYKKNIKIIGTVK